MPTLAFLGLVREQFMPPVLRHIQLPTSLAALGKLDQCDSVPERFAKWTRENFDKTMTTCEVTGLDVPVHRLFFFALIVHEAMDMNVAFPGYGSEHRLFLLKFAQALQVKLSETPGPVQTVVWAACGEHARSTHDQAYAKARSALGIPFSLVEEKLVPVLMLLRTLGWTRLPRAFCAPGETPEPSSDLAVSVVLRHFPAHVSGFEPEREFARTVFGDADRECMHPFMVMQCCTRSQVAVWWKMLNWPLDRGVLRGLRRVRVVERVAGEDVRRLLWAV